MSLLRGTFVVARSQIKNSRSFVSEQQQMHLKRWLTPENVKKIVPVSLLF
jgi:hypothetical protein